MKCIYKIVNKLTNECYVGSALNFYKRKYYHLYDLKKQKHHSPVLQNSWNKYGNDVFEFIVIEEIDISKNLIIREQFWIDKLNPKFNIAKIAGSPLGVKHTLQSRINMSNAHKGKSLKEMGHKNGCNCTVCTPRKKEQHPNFGKNREIRTRIKLSKPIIQLSLDGNIIKEWIGASDAAKILGISQSHISSCCREEYGRKTYKGFIWKFKN